MQQFFKNTIESKFIKYLLSYTPLPIFPTISSDDIMIAGSIYIYKDKILKCTETGRFNGVRANAFTDDHLYVQERGMYVTDEDEVLLHYDEDTRSYSKWLADEGKQGGRWYDPKNEVWHDSGIPGIGGLTVTDDVVRYKLRPIAKFDIIDDFAFGYPMTNITQTFRSNVSYYDPKTHRFLGDYLRCIRDIYGVDLMGLYNCFDYDSTDKFKLSSGTLETISPKDSKVFLIPIKFNKTYTIGMDSKFPIYVKAVFYKSDLLRDAQGNLFTDLLQDSVTKYNSVSFNQPITFYVENDTELNDNIQYETEDQYQRDLKVALENKRTLDSTLQEHEKYLYLAIEIPNMVNSSITVLEGDYSVNTEHYTMSAENIETLSDRQLSKVFRSELSLMQNYNGEQVAFADKLIAYLLQYTIDAREKIDENVAKIETDINYRPPLKEFVKGIWDTSLRYALYSKYMNIMDTEYLNKTDILGFVDRDIEFAASKGLINHGI